MGEWNYPTSNVRLLNTVRLVPSRYPSVGILDQIASPDDLDAIVELEDWTNDRISAEIGILHRIDHSEWVVGQPMSSVIMAAFCHPRTDGARFNGSDRGAWYAGRSLKTAHTEVIYHRTQELREVGIWEASVQVRAYLANFHTTFADIRGGNGRFAPLYDPVSYAAAQEFARQVFNNGDNGIVYRSVRDTGGECVVCFRPTLVKNVRIGHHFEYRWTGAPEPAIRRLA